MLAFQYFALYRIFTTRRTSFIENLVSRDRMVVLHVREFAGLK